MATRAELEYLVKVQDSELKRLQRDIRSTNRALGRDLPGATRSASTGMSRLGAASRTAGRYLAIGVGAGAAATGIGLYKAVQAAGDFESSLNTLQAVSGATGDQMDRISTLAKRLGNDVSLPAASAKDAADAMTELAKGGLSVKDSMAAAKGVLQLATAAQVDNAEAATIAARALNSFGLKGNQAIKVADLLAGTANASTAEIGDLALGMQAASAVFDQGNQSIDVLTTALGLMANAGIAGSDAGTSLKTMMLSLLAPTGNAASELDKMNVTLRDQQGHMLPLRAIIDEFSDATKNMSDAQRDAAFKTIFGTDAIRAANVILGKGTIAWDKMHDATTKGGDAARLAEAKMKGFKGSLEAFKSSLETLAITVGQKLLPVLTPVVQKLSDMVNFIDRIAEAPSLTVAVHILFSGIKGALGGIRKSLSKLLFGDVKRIPIEGNRFQLVHTEGLVAKLQAVFLTMDWTTVGQRIGTAISDAITFTADKLNKIATQILDWAQNNAGKIAEVGIIIAGSIVIKLTDPEFWAHHLGLLVGIIAAVFPYGRLGKVFGGIGLRIGKWIFDGLELAPGFRRLLSFIGSEFIKLSKKAKALVVLAASILARSFADALKTIISAAFDWIIDKTLSWVEGFLGLVDKAFGWIPGVGGKLDDAKAAVESWRQSFSDDMAQAGSSAGSWSDGVGKDFDHAKDKSHTFSSAVGEHMDTVKHHTDQGKDAVDKLKNAVDNLKSKSINVNVNASLNVAGVTFLPSGQIAHHLAEFAQGGLVKAVPGGVYRMAEAGYDEAVITTDPKHKNRTYEIISEVIRRIEGKRNILPGLASGGLIRAGTRRISELSGKVASQVGGAFVPPVRAFREAERMDALNRPYLWGGGHEGFSANGPWDCSGAVSEVLHAAGYPIASPMVSGALAGYGHPGRSGLVEILANDGHAYMRIFGRSYGTSNENPGGGWGGPLSYGVRSGFAERVPSFASGGIVGYHQPGDKKKANKNLQRFGWKPLSRYFRGGMPAVVWKKNLPGGHSGFVKWHKHGDYIPAGKRDIWLDDNYMPILAREEFDPTMAYALFSHELAHVYQRAQLARHYPSNKHLVEGGADAFMRLTANLLPKIRKGSDLGGYPRAWSDEVIKDRGRDYVLSGQFAKTTREKEQDRDRRHKDKKDREKERKERDRAHVTYKEFLKRADPLPKKRMDEDEFKKFRPHIKDLERKMRKPVLDRVLDKFNQRLDEIQEKGIKPRERVLAEQLQAVTRRTEEVIGGGPVVRQHAITDALKTLRQHLHGDTLKHLEKEYVRGTGTKKRNDRNVNAKNALKKILRGTNKARIDAFAQMLGKSVSTGGHLDLNRDDLRAFGNTKGKLAGHFERFLKHGAKNKHRRDEALHILGILFSHITGKGGAEKRDEEKLGDDEAMKRLTKTLKQIKDYTKGGNISDMINRFIDGVGNRVHWKQNFQNASGKVSGSRRAMGMAGALGNISGKHGPNLNKELEREFKRGKDQWKANFIPLGQLQHNTPEARKALAYVIGQASGRIGGATGPLGRLLQPGENEKIPAAFLASGGIIKHRPGGVTVVAGEGRYDEAVVPLPNGGLQGGHTTIINVSIDTVYGANSTQLARELTPKIKAEMYRDQKRNVNSGFIPKPGRR